MTRLKVENQPNYERDPFSKAIVNVDRGGLEAYKIQRSKLVQAMNTKKEIDNIKAEMSEIKSMLVQLINKQ